MKNKVIPLMVLCATVLGVVFMSGCIPQGVCAGAEIFCRLYENWPSTADKLNVMTLSSVDISSNIGQFKQECGDLQIKSSYTRVMSKQGDMNLIAWIDKETDTTVCVVREKAVGIDDKFSKFAEQKGALSVTTMSKVKPDLASTNKDIFGWLCKIIRWACSLSNVGVLSQSVEFTTEQRALIANPNTDVSATLFEKSDVLAMSVNTDTCQLLQGSYYRAEFKSGEERIVIWANADTGSVACVENSDEQKGDGDPVTGGAIGKKGLNPPDFPIA